MLSIFLILLLGYLFGIGTIEAQRRYQLWQSPANAYGIGLAMGLIECTVFGGPWWLAVAGGLLFGGALWHYGRSATPTATDDQPINQSNSNSTDTQQEIPQL